MDNPDRVTYFAATDSRGRRVPFGIKAKDRSKHMYVIGKTGMGKSTMLENMAIQDIRNGEGLAFIDPHGSAVEKLLDYVPENRIDDVVYFAPFDLDNPIAFNVMEDVGYDKRHLVVSGLMATFKKIWVDAWSARMEYILTNTLLALLEYPGATLLGVNRMYTDKGYRKAVVDNIKDPVVKDFWIKEFAGYTDKFTAEATPAIQNKIGQFTSNPLIRNIIGQPKSSFDIRDLMDRKKILLVNLSKGLVGDTNMKLLGSMITTRIFLGAMGRADLDPQSLKRANPFYFYVDEFQNFANETFAEILSEARKYNLNLIMTHQYVEQMEEEVAAAVFGNVGTTIAFRVGPFDAEKLEVVFAPEFTPEDLVNLGAYQIYMSLMIDGIGSRPFSALTIPEIERPQRSLKREVIDASRKQFAAPRANIENLIFTELSAGSEAPAEPKPKPAKREYSSAPRQADRGPRQDAPRPPRDERAPRPQNTEQRPLRADFNEPRPPRPRPEPSGEPAKAAPASSGVTSDDLKSILRTLSESAKKDADRKAATVKDDLKGALGSVAERPKPQGVEPPPKRTPPQDAPSSAAPAPAAPYEVPEQVLKDVFKNE